MDNLLAGILVSSLKRAKIPWLSRVSYRYQHSFSGVAGFTGMGGRFQTEWVAGFHRNRWPVWTGILILKGKLQKKFILYEAERVQNPNDYAKSFVTS
jgi:hypothetical protein